MKKEIRKVGVCWVGEKGLRWKISRVCNKGEEERWWIGRRGKRGWDG